MSAYGLQQHLFDQLRRWGAGEGDLPLDGTDLTAEEVAAVASNDIGALYCLGVHPVLLNAWCRATGHTRDDYKKLLAPYRVASTKVPPWRASS